MFLNNSPPEGEGGGRVRPPWKIPPNLLIFVFNPSLTVALYKYIGVMKYVSEFQVCCKFCIERRLRYKFNYKLNRLSWLNIQISDFRKYMSQVIRQPASFVGRPKIYNTISPFKQSEYICKEIQSVLYFLHEKLTRNFCSRTYS